MQSLIVFLLDDTGSMTFSAIATAKGFNHFVQLQQQREDDCDFYLAKFATEPKPVFEFIPIADVPPLTGLNKDRTDEAGDSHTPEYEIDEEATKIAKAAGHGGNVLKYDAEYDPIPKRDPETGQPIGFLPFEYWPRGADTKLFHSISETVGKVQRHIKSLPEVDRPVNVTFVIQTDGDDQSITDLPYAQAAIKTAYEAGWEILYMRCNHQDGLSARAAKTVTALGIKKSITYMDDHTEEAFEEMSDFIIESSYKFHEGE